MSYPCQPYSTYNFQTYWKVLKVKVENHTKIANCENKEKSKTPGLISPWLGGRKGKMSELEKYIVKYVCLNVITVRRR